MVLPPSVHHESKSMLLRRRIVKMAATAGTPSADTHILQSGLLGGNITGAMRNYESRAAAPRLQVRITDSIKHDHAELRSFYERIINSTDPDEQTRYQNQFTWELARHSVGEELVVYPAFEKYVAGGEQLAEKDRREHQGVCFLLLLRTSRKKFS